MFQLLDVEKKLQEGTKLEDSELMPAPSISLPRVVPTTPVEAKVAVLPSPREEAMSEKAHHRILRSSDSVNKRVPSSLFAAAAPEAINERKRKGDARSTIGGGEEHENHPGAGGHTAARKRNYSLQGGGEEVENSHPAARQRGARNRSLQGEARSKRTSTEPQARVPVRPSTAVGSRAASAAASKTGAGSRVTRPQAPAASSNKTRGWVR
jgi:hypothetical protein